MWSIRDCTSDEKEQTDVVFIVRLLHRTLYSEKCVYIRTLEHRILKEVQIIFRDKQKTTTTTTTVRTIIHLHPSFEIKKQRRK